MSHSNSLLVERDISDMELARKRIDNIQARKEAVVNQAIIKAFIKRFAALENKTTRQVMDEILSELPDNVQIGI